jgi:hypothetical protein
MKLRENNTFGKNLIEPKKLVLCPRNSYYRNSSIMSPEFVCSFSFSNPHSEFPFGIKVSGTGKFQNLINSNTYLIRVCNNEVFVPKFSIGKPEFHLDSTSA